MGPSDRILVWRLRRRDREACRELIRRHHAKVYGFLRRMGTDPALAEDLTQETYARAWERIESLRQAGSLRSWLLAIARNELLQHARRKEPEVIGPEGHPEPSASATTLEEDLLASERDERLHRAVSRLDEGLRETVVLHYFQELSFREVGAVLGLPAGTVKSRVHRALTTLRGLLEREGSDHVEREAGEATAGGP